MDTQDGPKDMKGCSLTIHLDLAMAKIKEENKIKQTFVQGNCVSASQPTSPQLSVNKECFPEDPTVITICEKPQGEGFTYEIVRLDRKLKDVKGKRGIPSKVEMKDKTAPYRNILEGSDEPLLKIWKRETEDIELASFRERETSSRGGEASTAASKELCDDGVKEELAASDTDNCRKRRQTAEKEANKRKPRRKAERNRPSPQTLPRMGTRRNPRVRRSSPLKFMEYKCPIIRWPLTNRPERPEYPACMEGAEEVEVGHGFESERWSGESSASEEDAADAQCAFEGLEASIVPGTLEAVMTFCRTSPILPPPLRPDPEKLRDLLHDSCVLQSILRGVSPATIAAQLDSEVSKSWPTNLAQMSDAAIFVGD